MGKASTADSRLFALQRKVRALPFTARNVALSALLSVDAGQSAQQALSLAFGQSFAEGADKSAASLPTVERNLCSELVYGYLRSEIRIAFVLAQVLPRPQSLPRPLLHVLGLAVYSLMFQDRIPDHAAVFSAVETTRALYGSALAKVANGALRSLQRLADAPLQPDFYLPGGVAVGSVEHLALFYSLPLWIVGHWCKRYGPQAAEQLAQRSFARPWSALRVNACHVLGHDLLSDLLAQGGTPVGQWGAAFAPGNLPAQACGKALTDLLACGAVSFQSAGSQLVLEKLGLYDWKRPVWDVCAGFGGKTVALLEREVAVAFSTDRNLQRLTGLPGQCARLLLPCPGTALIDAVAPPCSAWAGHMLIDVPCSGLGVLARRPDIRRRPQQQALEHEQLQGRMLERLVAMLQPGCELAYITCTLRMQENEKQIQKVMRNAPGLQLVRQWQTPHEHPWLEGMFGAVLRKQT